jgi:excinuclease ABC subunit C
MTTSILDDIPGIGPKRIKAIWKVFASLEELAKTKAEEIAAKAGIPPAVAAAIKERARKVGNG